MLPPIFDPTLGMALPILEAIILLWVAVPGLWAALPMYFLKSFSNLILSRFY